MINVTMLIPTWLNVRIRAGIEKDLNLKREKSKELALNTANKIKAYNKSIYDKRHRKPSVYKPDDLVMIRDLAVKSEENRKLKPDFKDPYKVTKVLDKNRYMVQDIPGYSLTSRSYNSIFSPGRMKLWIKVLPETLPANCE